MSAKTTDLAAVLAVSMHGKKPCSGSRKGGKTGHVFSSKLQANLPPKWGHPSAWLAGKLMKMMMAAMSDHRSKKSARRPALNARQSSSATRKVFRLEELDRAQEPLDFKLNLEPSIWGYKGRWFQPINKASRLQKKGGAFRILKGLGFVESF